MRTRRIALDWHPRTLAATVTTIHPQYGPLRRGVLRLHNGVWEITDGEGLPLGTYDGDFVDAERRLIELTPALDVLDESATTLTPARLRAVGEELAAEGHQVHTRPSYDPNPAVYLASGQTRADFYNQYADELDEWAPGWHRDNPRPMAPELRLLAADRRERENPT